MADRVKAEYFSAKDKATGEIKEIQFIPPAPSGGDLGGISKEKLDKIDELEDKADKTALVKIDRKLDALWKLNQGISYEFQTDDTEAYQKTVPSGAKVANVKSIGGKTIVWNQLITNARKISFSVKEEQDEGWLKTTNTMSNASTLLIKNHTYIGLLQTDCKNITVMNTEYGEVATGIFICNNAQRYNKDYGLYVVSGGVNVGEYYFSYMLFDLTQMFGSGNEPSTPEEFEAMFPADYYPYNEGELLSMGVNEVVEAPYLRNLYNYNDMQKYGFAVFDVMGGALLYCSSTLGTLNDWKIYDQQWKYIGGFDTLLFQANKPLKLPDNARHIVSKDDNDLNTRTYVGYNSDTSYVPYGENDKSYNIPQSILQLDGYGDSAGSVYNYVDFENKKYHKRVTKYTFQGSEQITNQQTFNTYHWVSVNLPNSKDLNNKITGDFVSDGLPVYGGYYTNSGVLKDESGAFRKYTNVYFSIPINTNITEYLKGKTIYYELAEPIVIDISNIIGNTFQEPLEVETGGTLTFKNSHGDDYRIPVPSSEEYVISLAEVAK